MKYVQGKKREVWCIEEKASVPTAQHTLYFEKKFMYDTLDHLIVLIFITELCKIMLFITM
jgi:hypothetical protein